MVFLMVVLTSRAVWCREGFVTPSYDDVVAHMPRSVLRRRWCYLIVGLVTFKKILKMYLAFCYINSSVDDWC